MKHNLKLIRSRMARKTKILIPVKSNAYGCGIIPVSKYLEKTDIDYLGVAFPFEGILLRKNGIKKPVLIFSEIIYEDDYEECIRYRLTPTVFTGTSLMKFDRIGRKSNKKIKVHINIDTGMGRSGVPFNEGFSIIDLAVSMKHIEVEGIYTHLSSADENNKRFTLSQLNRFQEVVCYIEEKNIKVPLIHVLNSAGIINYPEYSYSMVRPGIMFYGYFPDNNIRKGVKIKPCIDFRSKIIFTKTVKKETPVSYGHTYYSQKKEVIATVGTGYGDGMNRLLSNRGAVLYKDRKCVIRGRVCMDQFMIDISPVKNFKTGDLVTIFGSDRTKSIRLEEVASSIGTIPYEVLCLLGERVQRIYLS
ncbi:MAG: alanine racemase [Spirochaetes bacterium]|nr:alanine racemase [Spirochaetota bacterium]